ncbi:adenosine deaminase, tRNA-specific 3, partial [Tyrophagus putrescentiae]
PVVTAAISDKKKISTIVNYLSKAIPFDDSLIYLKRLNTRTLPSRLILVPSVVKDDDESERLARTLEPFGDELQNFIKENDLCDLKIQKVPATRPLNRQQFEKASAQWPVHFYEDKHITKCLNGTLFTADETTKICSLMSETLSLATSKTTVASSKSCHSMAALFVKKSGQIRVASAVSETTTSPLNHAVIMAIDQVANIHRDVKDGENPVDPDLRHFEDDYLCTNYDCYLSQDPCIMCAMALVHSRVKRVFIFNQPSDQRAEECDDEAYHLHKLHLLPNLNHKYEVWRLSTSSVENSDESYPSKRVKTNCDSK